MKIDLGEKVSMRFCEIPAGEFRMGARGEYEREEPVHRVKITRAFWLGEMAVTQEQFAAWKRDHKNHLDGKPRHPAESMTWFEAVDFCRWLTARLPDGTMACLPTEAEWEYACRAGTTTEYHSGDGEDALKNAGWFGEEWNKGSTHPAGSKEPNAFGLFDMHGNVWEWCHDLCDDRPYCSRVDGVCDPGFAEREAFYRPEGDRERSDNLPRVLRGGSWCDSVRFCRSAVRGWFEPGRRLGNFGFRVCLVPGPQVSQDKTSEADDRSRSEGRAEAEGEGGARGKEARAAAKFFSEKHVTKES